MWYLHRKNVCGWVIELTADRMVQLSNGQYAWVMEPSTAHALATELHDAAGFWDSVASGERNIARYERYQAERAALGIQETESCPQCGQRRRPGKRVCGSMVKTVPRSVGR